MLQLPVLAPFSLNLLLDGFYLFLVMRYLFHKWVKLSLSDAHRGN